MSVHIMVFDSGIGGTTVLEQIQALIPNADYSYFMDNALLPYGSQSQQTIIDRLLALLCFIESRALQVDILVIACNTASTSALEAIRPYTNIEVVGVVPAIKPACAISKSKHIGLLATPSTTKSRYTANLISTHSQGTRVSLYGSTTLVEIAEALFHTQILNEAKLAKVLSDLAIAEEIDVLVLGCTHFPLLASAISNYYKQQIILIDSGKAIAKRVESLISLRGLTFTTGKKKPLHYYATAPICHSQLSVELITLTDQIPRGNH
ncbi:glutamate racemase [Pseudoalteromonas sp. MEBiC 03607]|uniref:glutamate racemase n=1 Tax=Pseudoalteromonas sp. MEBiC 03607 TaxID=2563601 RepID=UPI001093C447|nr:glutamate racemase [Pseudoalteromonas sp. MEBiC 03607]TGV18693.1 glutamate racemase [Pseudoalteromonas sp. MEBiC 03607]